MRPRAQHGNTALCEARAGACQLPPWLSRNQRRSDGQQISMLQQMPRAVSRSPNLPVLLHQGRIMAGASSCGAICSTTLSPSTSVITGQGASGMSWDGRGGEGKGCGGGTQLGRCQPRGCGGAGTSPRLQCCVSRGGSAA